MLKKFAFAVALASAPIVTVQPALAQEEAPENSDSSTSDDMAKEMALFEKLISAFDTSDAEPIDEAQLKLARVASAAILPDGTYSRMMEKTFDQMLSPMAEIFSTITPQEIAIATGISLDQASALSAEETDQVASIIDPARKERGQKVFDLMIPLMEEAFAEIEPALREGMARAYARKFSAAQLKDLNAFFKTPTGKLYASESFVIMADPEVMAASMQAMPAMMEKVFAVLPEMEEEMKSAPQARSLSDLNDAELDRLAKLLSVEPRDLKQYRDERTDTEEVAKEPAEVT